MATRSEFFDFVIKSYYAGSSKVASEKTDYSVAQIDLWRSGRRVPQQSTIDYFLNIALVAEFKVIQEFFPFDSSKAQQTQLKEMLGEHKNDSGIYSFYDALGNLLYVGKATNLLAEINAAISRPINISFPKGIRKKPKTRKEVVSYISTYDVGTSLLDDYPKHVESLILRISKPTFNKNIGSLNRAYKAPAKA